MLATRIPIFDQMKKLSIITPSYKSEQYLSTYFENITSLVGFADYQIILILNQPTQKELGISAEYKKKYPDNINIVEVSLESIGASTNRGFLLADTEFITCADVDDIKKPDCFSRQMQTLEKHPEADVTFGDFMVVNKQGSTEGLLVKTPEFNKQDATRGSIVGPNHFFRKKLLEKCGLWDEQFKSGSDYDFQIREAFNADFRRTGGGILLYYTRYEGSGSASSSELQQIERTVIELRYGIYDKINYSFLPKALEYDIYHIYYNGQKKHVSEFVPNYKELMEQRYKKYFKKGIRRNVYNIAALEKAALGMKYFFKDPVWTYKKVIKKLKA